MSKNSIKNSNKAKSNWVETSFKFNRKPTKYPYHFFRIPNCGNIESVPNLSGSDLKKDSRQGNPFTDTACGIQSLDQKTKDIKTSFLALEKQVDEHKALVDALDKTIGKSTKGNKKGPELDSTYTKLINKNKRRLDEFDGYLESIQNSLDGKGSKGNSNNSDQKIIKLTNRISSLEDEIKSLSKVDNGDSGVVDSDVITGLKNSISSLEDAVKLDPITPSSNKDAGINYYLNRNYKDTQSIYTELSGIYDRLAGLENSISSTYNTDSNLDLLLLIENLTGRVIALEA